MLLVLVLITNMHAYIHLSGEIGQQYGTLIMVVGDHTFGTYNTQIIRGYRR
jgi:hypothetical protein